MADKITPKEDIKIWFQTGKKPTQDQFAAWMDSYWHKNESMTISNVDSLQSILDSKTSMKQVTADLNTKVDKVDGKGLSANDFTDEEKASLAASCIDFINYNKGGNGGDEFLRNGDSVYIYLVENTTTGFDPTTKKGLICFSLEAVADEANSSATVDFGEENVMLRWTDANNEIQTRYLYSNTGGTNAPGVKVKMKEIWGNVCLAYFTPDWNGVCILISATTSSTTSNTSGTVETITLNATTSTYTVTAETASTIKLIAETTGCTVTLPTTLTADKAVTFIIPDSSKAITVDGTIYQPGDTVFCVWDNDEQAWSINNTIQPTVTDYTNVTVKYALTSTNKSYKTTTGRGFKIYQPDTTVAKGDLVAVLSRVNYYGDSQYDATYGVEQGLYYVADKETANATTSYCWIKQITKGTTLQIVNATTYNAGVWDKTYPGATNNLVTFERLIDKANKTDVAASIQTLTTKITELSADKRAVCIAKFSTSTGVTISALNTYYKSTFSTQTTLGGMGSTYFHNYDSNTVQIENAMIARIEVHANMMFASSSTDMGMAIYKNETLIDEIIVRPPSTASYKFMMQTTNISELTAGDLITVRFMTTANKNTIAFVGGELIISTL